MIPIPIFVVFCPERLAIVLFSGIITTNLGETATLTEIAGRKKTDTSLQNMPFFLTGEGYFFWPDFFDYESISSFTTISYKHKDKYIDSSHILCQRLKSIKMPHASHSAIISRIQSGSTKAKTTQ